MIMEGWIKLHRQLLDSDLWKSEPFTRGQAWVDLLLLANHQESFFYKRGVKIIVKRGQLARSEVELSDRWKWSRTKVRKFLNDLKKEQQIEQQKTNVTQVVSIVNYELFQKKEQQIEQQKDSKSTAEVQQKNTYKNEKNEKNENIIKNKPVFNFRKNLIDFGCKENLVEDWLKVRKTKKATNSKTAFDLFTSEVKKSNKGLDDILKICIEKDWKGFKSEWLVNTSQNGQHKPITEMNQKVIEKMQQWD